MRLERVSLAELNIEDEASFRHVGLYGDLKRIVLGTGRAFLAPASEGTLRWDRALLLNLLCWEPGLADVLTSRDLPADVVAHVGWHHLGDRFVAPSMEAHLLAESIASAFDVYLVGRLLGHSPDSSFLESQVPRMAEAAAEAGVDDTAFELLLESIARSPEGAFRDLRALLFDASIALLPSMPPEEAAGVMARFDSHPMAALLHHFEIATWVLRSRIESARPDPSWDQGRAARDVDAKLRAEADPLAWLERHWVRPALEQAQP